MKNFRNFLRYMSEKEQKWEFCVLSGIICILGSIFTTCIRSRSYFLTPELTLPQLMTIYKMYIVPWDIPIIYRYYTA